MNSLKRSLKCLGKTKFVLYFTFNTFTNAYHATGLLLYLLKTSGNQRFFDVFRGYKKRPVASNGLMITRRSCITNFKQRINFMEFYGRHLACSSAFVEMEWVLMFRRVIPIRLPPSPFETTHLLCEKNFPTTTY